MPSARSPALAFRFTIPAAADLAPRLDDVLTVIYLSYNAGYLEPSESGRELSDDAIWLAELVARASRIKPRHGDCWHYSLSSTRGPPLDLMIMIGWCCWKIKIVVAGTEWQSVAPTATYRPRLPFARPGRFQLQAAIGGCHANAASWAETDWLQILTLYDLLLRYDSSPVIRLNHAIALSHLRGPDAALAEVEQVADRLSELPPLARHAGPAADCVR